MIQRLSKWTKLWIAWLVAFAIIELASALSADPHPRTLSEHLWHWFPKKFWRYLLVGLMSLLTWHFFSGPDVQPVFYTQGC